MRLPKAAVVLSVITVLVTGGVAVAAWLFTGVGTGTGKAAAAENLVVTAGEASADLYPGYGSGDVYVRVRNTNRFPVDLTSARIIGPVTPAGCQVTIRTGAIDLSGVPVIAAGATRSVTIRDALSMGPGADSTCQGAELTVRNVRVEGRNAP